jgi:hypothetical protein
MESKWPFILITMTLLFTLGLTIASLERTGVMNNWTDRRCELPVMMTAMFFKPTSDPRTTSKFAADNFDFCMKSYIEKFMALLMTPINALFGKHLNLATEAINGLNTIRNIATTLYNTLLSFLDTYYRRFNASVYQMSRITQYLGMAMKRANAVMISMLYTGLTMFRGMLNTIQFAIKVIMIVVGIMLAIIVILFFILFPFIPLILSVLSAIVAVVLSLSMVMSADIANQAEGDKGGFCFSEETILLVKDSSGNFVNKSVKDIQVGDELQNDIQITGVIIMTGKDIPLYNLSGVYVSGSHLVKGSDGIWKSVANDERATMTDKLSDILYCFNTSNHNIPINSPDTNELIIFRDWDELCDNDQHGNIGWLFMILENLNNGNLSSNWWRTIRRPENLSLLSPNTKVKTASGFVEVSNLTLMSKVVDRESNEQDILGLVSNNVESVSFTTNQWNTALLELSDQTGEWIYGCDNLEKGNDTMLGQMIITESGELVIWDEENQKEKVVRDFTDIGYKSIYLTYDFVASRLRLFE